MAPLILFEDAGFSEFLPLTYWRSLMGLRCGRKSLLDNAAFALRVPITGLWVRAWIADVTAMRNQLPVNRPVAAGGLLVNGRWVLNGPVPFRPAPFVGRCGSAIAYIACDARLAQLVTPELLLAADALERLGDFPSEEVDAQLAAHPWDLAGQNAAALRRHWTGDDRGSTGNVSSSAFLMNPDQIHVGDRTRIRPTAVIDATDGPVFISNDARIDVHTYVEGPAYIGPGCIVKPGTSIRAGTSLHSMCRVEGEIAASVFQGHVNKQHHGFIGDAYVGSWVNLGAGTTNSNLKNTYGTVSVQLGSKRLNTERQFAGCVIGDFARTGIGQLLPTGAVIGFGAMVATGGFCPKFVPSYAWLTADESTRTDLDKLRGVVARVMERRHAELSAQELGLFDRLPGIVEQFGV